MTLQAGSLAALSVDILIYPLDTVKTRLQAGTSTKNDAPGAKAPARLRFSGLYQGVGSVVAITLPAAAIFFTTYESVKNLLLPPSVQEWHGEKAFSHARVVASHATASATAELVSCMVLTPAEMIKQRAQVMRSQRSSVSSSSGASHKWSPSVQAFRETFLSASGGATTGGARTASLGHTLWRGYWALASRNLPFTAIQFPIYEHLRRYFSVRFGVGRPTIDGREAREDVGRRRGERLTRNQELLWSGASSALAGAGAGSVAALVTTPIDVVKTRIMLSSAPSSSSSSSSSSTSTASKRQLEQGVYATLRTVWHEEGVRGVMKGGGLRALWTALGAGIYLSSYETGRVWFRENFM